MHASIGESRLNDQLEFLHLIVSRLDEAGIPYMLTGSVAMSLYCQPRMTRDIDLVVECHGTKPEDWVRMFAADCYVSTIAVEEALSRGGMFNIIHLEGVAKADFIVRRPEEYRQVEFGRRLRKRVDGQDIHVVSPEDLVLSKLVWWKECDSAVQKGDLILLLESSSPLDMAYIEHWATRLGVTDQMEALRR
jgi:hypothetical protein